MIEEHSRSPYTRSRPRFRPITRERPWLYHAEKWRIGTIATQVGVHHTTVRRVLAQAGIDQTKLTVRPSIADPFIPFIAKTLEQHPRLRASRLYQMVIERGYPGGPDHFRAIVARYRPVSTPKPICGCARCLARDLSVEADRKSVG